MLIQVQLRDVVEDDLPVFYQQQVDEEAVRMADFPSRDWAPFLAHWRKVLADDSIVKKTVLYEGHVAGNMVCFIQDGERDVGYWLGRSYWNKGIATQALGLFLEFIPERPLYARVATGNLASQRVLEKCGFRRMDLAHDPAMPARSGNEYRYVLESDALIG